MTTFFWKVLKIITGKSIRDNKEAESIPGFYTWDCKRVTNFKVSSGSFFACVFKSNMNINDITFRSYFIIAQNIFEACFLELEGYFYIFGVCYNQVA